MQIFHIIFYLNKIFFLCTIIYSCYILWSSFSLQISALTLDLQDQLLCPACRWNVRHFTLYMNVTFLTSFFIFFQNWIFFYIKKIYIFLHINIKMTEWLVNNSWWKYCSCLIFGWMIEWASERMNDWMFGSIVKIKKYIFYTRFFLNTDVKLYCYYRFFHLLHEWKI